MRVINHSDGQHLSLKHVAHLYFGIEHRTAVANAHRLVVDLVAAARRRRDPRWRLVGRTSEDAPPQQLGTAAQRMGGRRGLRRFGASAHTIMYRERFGSAEAGSGWRIARNARLRDGRIVLIASFSSPRRRLQQTPT